MNNVIRFKHFIEQISDAYYRRAKIGDDFYTAVSLGKVFGSTLAASIAAKIYANNWQTQPIDIIEFGAASGILMKDVIEYLQANYSDLYKQLRFCISEPKQELKKQQIFTLGNSFVHIDKNYKSPRAIIFANELFDALGFDLISGGYFYDVYTNQNDFKLMRAEAANAQNIAKRLGFMRLDEIELFDAELLTGCAEFLLNLKERFEEFWLISFDYAAPCADRLSARVFYQHKAPILLTEANLNALANAEADVTYTPAIDQLQAICAHLGFRCDYFKQAIWLIDHKADEIALKYDRLDELKHLCFGLGENFCAFEIAYKKI